MDSTSSYAAFNDIVIVSESNEPQSKRTSEVDRKPGRSRRMGSPGSGAVSFCSELSMVKGVGGSSKGTQEIELELRIGVGVIVN